MAIAVVGAGVCALGALPSTAGAGTGGRVLPTGSVVQASFGGATTAPADGRIRGIGVDAVVSAVAWPGSARAGGRTVVAGAGHRLVVFSLSLTEAVGTGSLFTGGTRATVALDVGGTTRSVPLTTIDNRLAQAVVGPSATASATFCASVPAHTHDVDLVVTHDGYAQRFDLWSLERVPPAPPILYRAPTGSFGVTASSKGTTTLPARDATGHSAPIALSVRRAFLSAFNPDGAQPTTAATQAYLNVELYGTDEIDTTTAIGSIPWTFEFTPAPASLLTFTPTGGAPLAATEIADPTASRDTSAFDDGLFDAFYSFVVPASTTGGVLSVAATTLSGKSCSDVCGPTGPIALGAGTIALSFPPVPAPLAHQHRPPWVGRPPPATGTLQSQEHPSRPAPPGAPSGRFPIWLAVVLLGLAAVATVVWARVVRGRRHAERGSPERSRPDPGSAEPTHLDPGHTAASEPDAAPLVALAGDVEQRAGPVSSAPLVDDVRSVPPSPAPSHLGPTLHGDAAVSAVPPLGAEGDLVIRFVGPVEITGWDPPRDRPRLMEDLCCYLGAHATRPRSSAEIMEALWPVEGERAEASKKTLHNTMAAFRQAVGAAHLPDAPTTGGYLLVGVVTDWAEITRLLADAAVATPTVARARRAEALAHVRGNPFEGAHGTQFHWAYATNLVWQIARTVSDCAHELAGELFDLGDPLGAERAARRGLLAAPDDERLWLDAARSLAASEHAGALEALWRDAASCLGAERVRALRRAH